MKSFTDWKSAHEYAAQTATDCNRDCGLWKTKEFGRTVFNVSLLPDQHNRTGHEMQCEIVKPYTPTA